MEYGLGITIAIILVCLALLFITLVIIRHYVFNRFLQKQRNVRATVADKRCTTNNEAPAREMDIHDAQWTAGDPDLGCLGMAIFLLSALPWKGLAKNGLDEPYQVRFNLGEKKSVNLVVSYEVYMRLNKDQEGVLTYKGNCFQRFKSMPTDAGGPADIVEKSTN
jgi:hypothetical protein